MGNVISQSGTCPGSPARTLCQRIPRLVVRCNAEDAECPEDAEGARKLARCVVAVLRDLGELRVLRDIAGVDIGVNELNHGSERLGEPWEFEVNITNGVQTLVRG